MASASPSSCARRSRGERRGLRCMRRNLELPADVAVEMAGSQDVVLRALQAHLDCKLFLRVNLTRPAVEAGERLGFLPGDLMAKVDPYLRPLFDALHDMLDPEKVSRHLERGVIEIAPLAFMRGRTLNDSFVILDEAQNTTPEQMKMFLTRLGFGSRMVVTGDITQVDLPRDQRSGLIVVGDILDAIEEIEFVRFGAEDVVRHKLVQRIVEAYDEHAQREPAHALPDEAKPSEPPGAGSAERRS